MSKKSRIFLWILFAVIGVVLVGILFSNVVMPRYSEIKTSQFMEIVNEQEYKDEPITDIKLDVNSYTVKGSFKKDGKTFYFKADISNVYSGDAYNAVLEQWRQDGIIYNLKDPNSGSWVSTLMSFLGIVVVAVIFWLIMRSAAGGGQVMNVGKTKAHVQSNLKVRFTDVAGAEEEKEELKEVVDFLKNPKKFSDLGAKIPRGVLLVGPPGTGKTLFAKAVAGEAGVPFFSVSGSDFVEMYVGVGAARVRDLFDMAKKNQPCIIFVDEIDAVGRRRGAGLGGGHDEREQTLNQILVQMDGFETNEGVIVMAATNRVDILDPALLRPGRFDRQVQVNLPDVKGREQILKVHARNKPMEQSVNFKTVARITAGFSGAELANLLNEAAILAARKGKKFIGNLELYDAINKVLMGPQKKSRVVTESDKRCTAYHESGHAILACLCKHCDPVHEVSIIPRGRAAGYTMTRPDSDDNDVSYNKLVDNICMSLGGRVAEEIVIQDITTGASADLQHVSDLARRMVKQWGMSEKLGLVAYDTDQPVFMGMDYEYGSGGRTGYSQETASEIDSEVRRLITEAHERAKKLLNENRDKLDVMSRVLVEKETIYTEEVQMIMQGASYDEVIAYMDKREGEHEADPFREHNVELKKETTEEKTEEQTPVVESEVEEKVEKPEENETEDK